MLQTISIVVFMQRRQPTFQTPPTFERLLPLLAVSNNASPHGWAQIWAHEFLDAANGWTLSTSERRPSLPWAQGVAGSNPVAPTTFRVPG